MLGSPADSLDVVVPDSSGGAALLSFTDSAVTKLPTSGKHDPEASDVESLARDLDLSDLNERLDAAQSNMRRHGLWALLGVSPLALVPIAALFLEGSATLLIVLITLVVLVESWRYATAKEEVRRLGKLVEHLEAQHGVDVLPSPDPLP